MLSILRQQEFKCVSKESKSYTVSSGNTRQSLIGKRSTLVRFFFEAGESNWSSGTFGGPCCNGGK